MSRKPICTTALPSWAASVNVVRAEGRREALSQDVMAAAEETAASLAATPELCVSPCAQRFHSCWRRPRA